MSKRLRLLKNAYTLNMQRLVELRTSDPRYMEVAETVTKLHKRIKRKPKVRVVQESMFRQYVCTFKVKGEERRENVTATTRNNAEQLIKSFYGKRTQIISIE